MRKTKGRPKGSEKDDSKALNAMADMILADPALKPTTAMRRYSFKIHNAEIRRLQVKWKERKEMLLTAARKRAEVQATDSARLMTPARHGQSLTPNIDRRLEEFYNSPAIRAARGIQESPALRAMMEFQNSPTMRAIRGLQDSPTMRIMRDISSATDKINRVLGGR